MRTSGVLLGRFCRSTAIRPRLFRSALLRKWQRLHQNAFGHEDHLELARQVSRHIARLRAITYNDHPVLRKACRGFRQCTCSLSYIAAENRWGGHLQSSGQKICCRTRDSGIDDTRLFSGAAAGAGMLRHCGVLPENRARQVRRHAHDVPAEQQLLTNQAAPPWRFFCPPRAKGGDER